MTSPQAEPPRLPLPDGEDSGVSDPSSCTQRPWYRRTWKRVAVTMVIAAALGVGAGLAFLYAGQGATGGLVAGVARDDLSGTGRAVTEYRESQRGQPVQVSGTTLAGEPFSIQDLRGDVVVLNVWGSWCAPCRAEAPILAKAHAEFTDDGVSFAGINVRDNEAAAIAFERRYEIPYPSIADFDGRTLLGLNQYIPVSAVPVTLVLDRQGRVASRVLGEVREATLTALLDEVLTEPTKAR